MLGGMGLILVLLRGVAPGVGGVGLGLDGVLPFSRARASSSHRKNLQPVSRLEQV